MQLSLPKRALTERERRAAVAIARALLPSTALIGGADEVTVRRTEEFLLRLLPESVMPWGKANAALNQAARAYTGKPLEELGEREAEELIAKWAEHPVLGKFVSALASIYKITHFDRSDIKGQVTPKLDVITNLEQPRWLNQVERAENFEADEDVECDVVVIGTGAGGAVVGRHLADQGHAVMFVEEGEHVRRNEFPNRLVWSIEHLYRNVITLGNTPVMIPQGRLVGGSTAVNGGSSFRPPRWVTDRWCEEFGSSEFSTEALEPYFARTEGILEVEKANPKYMGPIHEIFKRGTEKLGWHNDIIRRNAPGCEGKGFCDNGCRTDARRSTNISYIPPALEKGAFLLTGLRAERLLMEHGRAVGIEGVALRRDRSAATDSSGREKRVRVRAKTVILAAGALASPAFLLSQGIANSSDQVGRNMTFHPSAPLLGTFDEPVNGGDYIPQADYSFEFLRKGILLLSAQPDRLMAPPLLPFVGRRLMTLLEQSDYFGGVGYLLADTQKGRLRLGPGGKTIVTYNISKEDVRRAQEGIALCAELLFAAGAKEIYPTMNKPLTFRDRASLERFRQSKLRASDLLLMSYHPLGSCKMSPDPKKGVVDLNHQAHDVPGLFIVDGSTVSGPLGVNPQITIMGLATRAAEKIGKILE